MRYEEHLPSKDLQPYIKCFWVLETQVLQPERILPDGCMELIFHYEDLYEVEQNAQRKIQGRSFIFGQIEQAISLTPSGKTGMLGMRFHPYGLAAFSSIPLAEFFNTEVELTHVWGPSAGHLENALQMASSTSARIQLLEAFLRKQMKGIEPLKQLQHGVSLLKSAALKGSWQRLGYELNLSERQMERHFARYIGMSPKKLHRMFRLQRAIHLIEHQKELGLLHIALEAGYYDQAHFNREFKNIVGASPKAYYQSDRAIGALFLDAP